MKRGFMFLTVVAVAAMLLVGCAVSETPSQPLHPTTQTPSSGPSMGIIRVLVTDAPVDEVTAARVSFSGVWLHKVGEPEGEAGWIKLEEISSPDFPTFEEGEINLAELRDEGAMELLAEAPIETGWYNQIRLILNEDDGITVDYTLNGETYEDVAATLPSGKLRFVHPSFQLTLDETTEIVFDFDLEKSVLVTGATKEGELKVIFKPVVKLQITEPTSVETSASVEMSGLSLQIIEPEVDADSSVETDEDSVIIQGSVSDPAAMVTVNDESAIVEADTGTFSHEVQLSPGENHIEIAAALGDEEVTVVITVYTQED